MGRVGLSSKDTVMTQVGFTEGNFEIVDAKIKVIQFQAAKDGSDGGNAPVVVAMVLSVQPLNKEWKSNGEDPIDTELGLGGSNKDGSFKFHPGIASGPDDDEPEDQGEDVGAEGNTICGDGNIDKRSKSAIFCQSLEENGFKPELLNGYMPNLIGLQAHGIQKALEKSGDRQYKRDPSALVVDKINRFPYQKGGSGTGVKAGAGAAKPVGAVGKTTAVPAKPAAKPTPKQEAAANGNGAGEVDEELAQYAMMVLTELGAKKSGKVMSRTNQFAPVLNIPGQLTVMMGAMKIPDDNGELTKKLPPIHHKAIRDLVAGDWFLGAAEELGWGVEDDAVTIP